MTEERSKADYLPTPQALGRTYTFSLQSFLVG
jgi:hypothetical protein